MLTKAYVVSAVKDKPNKYVVRIPLLNSAANTKHSTPDSELSEATVCSLPASSNILHPGDCVYVGFENNDLGSPVIIGHLFAETLNNTPIDINVRKLIVDDTSEKLVAEARLPKNTKIGNVSANNIQALEGCNLNIKDTFYYGKIYFTDNNSDSPSNIYVGTTWDLIGNIVVGATNIYVWHRTL